LLLAGYDASAYVRHPTRAAPPKATFPISFLLQAARADPRTSTAAEHYITFLHSSTSQWTSFGHCRPSLGTSAFPAHSSIAPTNLTLRTLTALAVVVSAAGYGGIISLSNYVFFKPFVFTTKIWPQLWRPLTAFLITKPKFGILLDPYFCYQYGSGLERESSRFSQPGDFATYTAFVGAVIMVSYIALFCFPSITSHHYLSLK
jgi:hypothetical protein